MHKLTEKDLHHSQTQYIIKEKSDLLLYFAQVIQKKIRVWIKTDTIDDYLHGGIIECLNGQKLFSVEIKSKEQFGNTLHIASEFHFFFQFEYVAFFFHTTFFSKENNHFLFNIPNELYRLQRRDHFRVTLPYSSKCVVHFNHPIFKKVVTKEVNDLSTSGFSFIVNPQEIVYKPKVILSSLSIETSDQKIVSTSGEIVHLTKLALPNNEYIGKCGVKFKSLIKNEERNLFQYLLKCNRIHLTAE